MKEGGGNEFFSYKENQLSLDPKGNLVGALVCTPEIFSVIYKLEQERVKRKGHTSLLFRINFAKTAKGVEKELKSRFVKQLRSNLRAGDSLSILDGEIYILTYDISINEWAVIVKRIIGLIEKAEVKAKFELECEVVAG